MHGNACTAGGSGATGGQRPLKCAIDINTSSAPPAEQYDLFRSWHSNIADVELLRDKFETFTARERVWQLGSLVLALIEYPGTGYFRRWSSKKNPIFDHWLISMPQTISSDNGRPEMSQLRWQCLAAPHQDQGEDDGILCLFLPRDFAVLQSLSLEIRPDMMRFIIDYMILLYGSLADRTENDVPFIAAATTSLISACITPSRDHFVEAQGAIDAVLMARATRFIATRLADRNLTPGRLCHELDISRSRLYRIFEPMGGISNYIRRQRLLKTRDALADSANGSHISSIAEKWGFSDASTYSRAFKKEFRFSPKDTRAADWLGIHDASSLEQSSENTASLSNLLLNNYLCNRQL
ncbi:MULTISPECIES: helix-turn-helix domain-containing protein [unclassified Beijerinckia]|uniref:helix-turn-helix domain-containing protein n=1 Tax=unclassified Beijerinckia TaxID=2638183 RepID=UPI000896463F|nr:MULTISPECIES: helix-turn-helix domain-containing protein [unclassified Beijerinckia]MDH7798878.1 AraC-like DNA-binding protein [Beijerinckia sp. GAS462]SED88214.1 AraC-type DNA-binding protein [Beijerinckia sp. 28-YEA-48]